MYLARRPTASTVRPARRAVNTAASSGTTNCLAQLLTNPTSVRPTSGWRKARTTVSTSGSSGMGE
jgi:hypothetical protein